MSRPASGYGGAAGLNAVRPGTGQRGMLGSSAGRLKTGQVPATPGQAAGYGVSLNTEVQVSERPVTQQGMMGMRVGTAGPKRQVQDASFFMGKLHQKIAEITAEIQKLQKEIEQDARDKSQATQLERKYDTLVGEVRQLEGQLADYNLATDKLRSATDPEELLQYKEHLKQENAAEASRTDAIFLQRQELERKIKESDSQIQKLYRDQEASLNQLHPTKLASYKELCETNRKLESEISPKQQDLDTITYHLRQKETQVANDRWRNEWAALEKQVIRLKKERDSLEADAETIQLPPEEARAQLLAKVKDDNLRTVEYERKVKEVSEEIAQMNKTIADLKTDIEERKGESGESNKFEILQQRDEEMTSFIASFPVKKAREEQQQRETQETIIALLEHISRGIEREGSMPNPERFNELKGDLTFKEKQLETAQVTKQRLEQELQKRYAELEKINTLDDKIDIELSSLNQKIEIMTSDMIAFKDVVSLKKNADNTRQELQRIKQKYIRRRDAIKQQTNLLNSKYEKRKNELSENETAKGLESLQMRIRYLEQNIFHLREDVNKRVSETEYKTKKEECSQIVMDINNAILKLQSVSLRALP